MATTDVRVRPGNPDDAAACAAITQPNDASNAFHRSFGFERVGLLRRVGWKHDRWHDVAWMQVDLADAEEPPAAVS